MIRLSKSTLLQKDINSVIAVLEREHLGMGQEVKLFEEKLKEYFGRPVICVSNGTAALHLALQALGIGSGDEVLVQSLTYVASFQAISATGASPVACDIVPETLTIDLQDAQNRITENTKAIMPVHYGGGYGVLEDIYEFADRNNLRVVEDAAHAFGSVDDGKCIGGFGDIACFSFDGIKNITSGEGGCVVTNDEEILKNVRNIRVLGIEHDLDLKYDGERIWKFDVSSQGWRYHMSNIMAAIGIQQLERLSIIAKKRRRLASYYDLRLKVNKKVRHLAVDYENILPHIYTIIIEDGYNRDECRSKLEEKGVETGVNYFPNHLLKYYYQEHATPLSVTDKIYKNLITLPLHLDLEESDIDYICDSLDDVLK